MLGLNALLFDMKVFCMHTSTITKEASRHSVPRFELCSVIVLATFAMGTASATRAQGAVPSTGGALMAAAGAVPAGKVTSMELDAAFNRADVNRDGKLSRAETEHFPMVAQRFEQTDSNHDSFISREEFNKAASN